MQEPKAICLSHQPLMQKNLPAATFFGQSLSTEQVPYEHDVATVKLPYPGCAKHVSPSFAHWSVAMQIEKKSHTYMYKALTKD
jgi:hypothetical protein